MGNTITVETSARHVHLTDEHVEILFGKGYKLTEKKRLSQPTEYACEERVDIIGAKKELKNVIILGPTRKATQIEVSLTDTRTLGVDAPIRESGDVAGSAPCKIVGPCGSIDLTEGVIVAKRHIHLPPDIAEKFGLANKQIVKVKINSERTTIFDDVVVRVNDTFMPFMHIDTDEANACAANGNVEGEIIGGINKSSPGTQINFGRDFIEKDAGKLINEVLSTKIVNLRKNLKEDLNIDMPSILIQDNIAIGKAEIVIVSERNIKWKQDFGTVDSVDFEKISDTIISELKKIYA